MTEVKQASCDDEKKSYARLALDKTHFKKNNLEKYSFSKNSPHLISPALEKIGK